MAQINPGLVERHSSPWGSILGGIIAAATTIATMGAAAPAVAAGEGAAAAGEGAAGAAAGSAASEFGKDVAFGSLLKGGGEALGTAAAADTPTAAGSVVGSAKGIYNAAKGLGSDTMAGASIGGTVQNVLTPRKVTAQGLPVMQRKLGDMQAPDYGSSPILDQQLAVFKKRLGMQ